MNNSLALFRPAALPVALSCALAAWAPAHAQSTLAGASSVGADTLPTTVVTATRVAQPVTDVLADVTLLDEQKIQESGAVTVSDLLQRQPGIELSRNGGPGTTTSLYLRGADTRFTAVYIDGIRVDSQATGGAPWDAIALGQVERIEIMRGPAAAVYGSDAMAGVVQIFTKKGEGPFTPYVGVGAGNRRTGRIEAGFSGQTGPVDYALGIERDVSRGYNIKTNGNPDDDGYRQTSASGRLGWQINPDQRVELTGTHTDMKSEYDSYMPDLYDLGKSRLSTLGANWNAQWTKNYSTRVSVSESQQRYETTPLPYLTKTTLHNYLWQNEWRQGDHLFPGTRERREDKLVNDPIDRSRHQDGIALGYAYTGGSHTLQVNVRHDHDSEFGGEPTGSVAYGYRFAPNWRVTAGVSTAYRAPTLYQRFSQYGDADLSPEKGRNVEVGLHWAQQSSRFGVTAYYNRVRNLIGFGAAGACESLYGCYENTGRAILRGVTISGAHKLAGVNLSGSLDLQDPHDADTGNLLARRAKHIFKLNADTRVADWTLGAELQAVSHRWDNAANTVRLAGYGLLNLYASTTIAREWQLLARIDNVGDRDYQLANTYTQPGRTFYVGLRWTPKP